MIQHLLGSTRIQNPVPETTPSVSGDTEAQVWAEGGRAVVPPAEDAAGGVVKAEGVEQAQRLQAAQGVAFGGGGEDVVVVPDGRVVHVAVVGGDVEDAQH